MLFAFELNFVDIPSADESVSPVATYWLENPWKYAVKSKTIIIHILHDRIPLSYARIAPIFWKDREFGPNKVLETNRSVLSPRWRVE